MQVNLGGVAIANKPKLFALLESVQVRGRRFSVSIYDIIICKYSGKEVMMIIVVRRDPVAQDRYCLLLGGTK